MNRWAVSCCWAASILQHHDLPAEKVGQLINQQFFFFNKSDCTTNSALFI